jgi:hypothetical protein
MKYFLIHFVFPLSNSSLPPQNKKSYCLILIILTILLLLLLLSCYSYYSYYLIIIILLLLSYSYCLIVLTIFTIFACKLKKLLLSLSLLSLLCEYGISNWIWAWYFLWWVCSLTLTGLYSYYLACYCSCKLSE